MINYIFICLVTGIVLLATYKLGYYVGNHDGVEDGVQIALNLSTDMWDKLLDVFWEDEE